MFSETPGVGSQRPRCAFRCAGGALPDSVSRAPKISSCAEFEPKSQFVRDGGGKLIAKESVLTGLRSTEYVVSIVRGGVRSGAALSGSLESCA